MLLTTSLTEYSMSIHKFLLSKLNSATRAQLVVFCLTLLSSELFYAEAPKVYGDDIITLRKRLNAGQAPHGQVSADFFSSSGPVCGIYALCTCMATEGLTGDCRSLVSTKYIGSVHGSTAQELAAAAKISGAHTAFFSRLTHRNLQYAQTPMILHVRSGHGNGPYNHWVAFLGYEGDLIRIRDGLSPVELLKPAELLAIWDGFAIAIAKQPISTAFLWQWQLLDYLLVGTLWSVALFSVSYLLKQWTSHKRSQCGEVAWWKYFGLLAPRAVALLGGAVLLALLLQATSSVGFFRNPTAVAEVKRFFYESECPTVSYSEVDSALKDGSTLFLDARRYTDFSHRALPGAISLPVNCSMHQRRKFLALLPKSTPIIVYCQSAGCKYSDQVATFLKFNEVSNVRIYREGFAEWSSMNRPKE